MTREEAIHILQKEVDLDWFPNEKTEALKMALTALHPVSREQVEKMRGEWIQDERGQVMCSRCGSITAIGTKNALHNAKRYDRFCFCCGAPMTDEAVDIRLNELEALNDG